MVDSRQEVGGLFVPFAFVLLCVMATSSCMEPPILSGSHFSLNNPPEPP
jgi:hypothetical protein